MSRAINKKRSVLGGFTNIFRETGACFEVSGEVVGVGALVEENPIAESFIEAYEPTLLDFGIFVQEVTQVLSHRL